MFVKYQHVERVGNDEVEGLLDGECWVFPKLDGTNASVWLDEGRLCAGSRNRMLSTDEDNMGFCSYVLFDSEITDGVLDVFSRNKDWTLYGEWLCPHTLKTYRSDAWRKFYVFDVLDREAERYLSYDEYAPLLSECGLEVIPPIVVVANPTIEFLTSVMLKRNTYLIADGQGVGEGIVIKRYDFVNRYGRPTWGKLVRNEFNEKNLQAFGVPNVEMTNVEYKIACDFLTVAIVEKVLAQMTSEQPWSSRRIPEFLSRVWHDFITEELWDILKKLKNPTIDFKRLNRYVVAQAKALAPQLFRG